MTVTRADLLTRLTNPAKASAETQNTVLLTSAACADMLEAKAEIERLRAIARQRLSDRNDADTEIERLQAVLGATRKLVSEAAMTGFNCHDGDWAERLFANQAAITAALAPALEQKAGEK